MIAAAFVLWRELRTLSFDDVMGHIQSWGPGRIGMALLLSAATYAVLATNEWISLRWLGSGLSPGTVGRISFTAYAFGNTIGFNLLVATAIRTRAYARHGVPFPVVAAASIWDSQVFWCGLSTLAGVSLLVNDGPFRWAGSILLLLPIVLFLACAFWRKEVRLRGRSWVLPPPGMAMLQMGIGLIGNFTLAGVLWSLFAGTFDGFFAFAGAYAASLGVGLMSGAPGGIGVFETAMLTLLPDADRAALAAAFIGYRLSYFLLPLTIGAAMLLWREWTWKAKAAA